MGCDSGASIHLTRVTSMLLGVLERNSYCNVKSGTCTKHAVKGVGTVIFHLESRCSLEVVEIMYVLGLSVSFLSVLTLEDEGYAVMFEDA